MPVVCLAVPHFALRVAVLGRPELDGAPLVLAAPPGARPRVLDASPEAAARGVRPGMGLREVPLLCPDAITLPPHPAREAAAAERVLAGLAVLSPAVEPDAERPGYWYVELRGSERSLGPPAAAAARLLATMPPPLRPRAGVGPGKFAARVAASGAIPGRPPVVVGEDKEVAAFLAPAPVALLPLPPETARRMERLGLRTLGDLAALPAVAARARFGADGGRARDLAAGIDADPVRPQAPPAVVSAALALPAPATTLAVLKLAVRRLAARAFARPELRGRHARQARLLAALEGGGSWEVLATLREPGGEERVTWALGYKLDGAELPGPVERLALDVVAPIDAVGRQEGLAGAGFRTRRPREVAEAARQLAQRFGSSGLYRAVEVEPWSRIPERRMGLLACDP
jgi:nucleotidyltransferase/DNA polymerase involved in DNA repair